MKTLTHHINTVRAKPPHIRKQVAYGVALGATALIAVVWFASNLAEGSYALQAPSFSAIAAAQAANTAHPAPSNTGLLGAVGAAFTGPITPAHIEVVNAGTSAGGVQAAAAPASQPTIIPF